MTTKYKMGSNLRLDMLEGIIDLNCKEGTTNLINEFYGSIRQDAWLSARPEFRLPDLEDAELENYVKECNDLNITFNYTLNTISPGSKEFLAKNKKRIQDRLRYLIDIGIGRITMAHPLLMELLREIDSNFPLEVSTIAEVRTISQIRYYKDMYNADKICLALERNRDISWLEEAAKVANEIEVNLELLANEFCMVGAEGYTTPCTYRTSCYEAHATDTTQESAENFNCYPMDRCMTARAQSKSAYLKSKFIRPEDVKRYHDIGIRHMKITGRTGSTDYILKMAEAYLAEKYEGNLLGLWKQLDTIYNHKSELEDNTGIYIDNRELDGFMNYWFQKRDFRCAEKDCGYECSYCDNFLEWGEKREVFFEK